jgi:hypothetical protein
MARAGETRFTDQELSLILKKAADLQEGDAQSGVARYTLAEIQQIAAEAGIDPNHVATVAAGLRSSRAQGANHFLGAPSRYRHDRTMAGEVDDDVVGELFERARRELGIQGAVTEALGTVEWTGSDAMGSTHVTVTRRAGSTTISVLSSKFDAAALTVIPGAMGAVLGPFGVGTALVALGLPAPIAGVAGVVGAVGGSWLAIRALWRVLARRYSEHTATLGESLAGAAQRAIEDGRLADNPAARTLRIGPHSATLDRDE